MIIDIQHIGVRSAHNLTTLVEKKILRSPYLSCKVSTCQVFLRYDRVARKYLNVVDLKIHVQGQALFTSAVTDSFEQSLARCISQIEHNLQAIQSPELPRPS